MGTDAQRSLLGGAGAPADVVGRVDELDGVSSDLVEAPPATRRLLRGARDHLVRGLVPELAAEPHHQLLGDDRAARQLEVRAHPVGAYLETLEDPRELVGDAAREDAGLRHGEPLGGPRAHVALAGMHAALEHDRDGAAQEPRRPDQVLARHRVPLLRHRRRADVPGHRGLAQLVDLAGLEPDDLGGDPLAARADLAERVAQVAQQEARHVPRALRDGQVEPVAVRLEHGLGGRPERGERSGCACERRRERAPAAEQRAARVHQLVSPRRGLEPERDRHRVLAVRAARHRRRGVALGERRHRDERPREIGGEQRTASRSCSTSPVSMMSCVVAPQCAQWPASPDRAASARTSGTSGCCDAAISVRSTSRS